MLMSADPASTGFDRLTQYCLLVSQRGESRDLIDEVWGCACKFPHPMLLFQKRASYRFLCFSFKPSDILSSEWTEFKFFLEHTFDIYDTLTDSKSLLQSTDPGIEINSVFVICITSSFMHQ